jgi:hypothetical protein
MLDLDCRNSFCFRTDMIAADGPKGVHHICVAFPAKDLFLGIFNVKLATPLDVAGAGLVK